MDARKSVLALSLPYKIQTDMYEEVPKSENFKFFKRIAKEN